MAGPDWEFGEDQLRTVAGERSFRRAAEYLDAVTDLEVGDRWITATVYGTEAYAVELTARPSGGVAGDCDCPYGQDGNFCKHCVAVGLAVLGRGIGVAEQAAETKDRSARLFTAVTEAYRLLKFA